MIDWMQPLRASQKKNINIEIIRIAFTANRKREIWVEKFLNMRNEQTKTIVVDRVGVNLPTLHRFSCSYWMNSNQTKSEWKTWSRGAIYICRVSSFNDLSLTVHYNYTKIGRFRPILSIRIVLSRFYLLLSHFENFSTWISCLPFALNPGPEMRCLISLMWLPPGNLPPFNHGYRCPIFAWVSSGYIHHLLDPAGKAAKDRLKLIIYLQGNSRQVV